MPKREDEVPPAEGPPENEALPSEHELTAPAAPPETRFRRFLRISLRWLAGLLVVFASGFLAAILLLYRPETQENARLNSELRQANQRIAELENEVAQLEALRTENEALHEELESTRLHLRILRAQADVHAARLALANDQPIQARLQLTNTADALRELGTSVEQEHRQLVASMQNRLELALEELERDTFAADSDLGVLAMNLMQLENTYFTRP